MSIGSIQTIVVCVPSAFAQAPCPTGQAVTTIQAYVIDPAQAASVEAQNAPFDYSLAAGMWTLGFTFVVGLYLVTKSAGTILLMIRK
jgi:hypothetical protein